MLVSRFKIAAVLTACWFGLAPVPAHAQLIATELATDLAKSFAKSIISAVAGQALNRLFGTSTLSAEEAARQVRAHLAALDLKEVKIDTRALGDDVHDYIVERNTLRIDTRRDSVRDILTRTSAVEAELRRLLSEGHMMDVGKDYMMVVSLRLTFVIEQDNVDFAASVGNNSKSLAQSRKIVASEAHRNLVFLANRTIQGLDAYEDHTFVNCFQRIPHKPLYTASGNPVPDRIHDKFGGGSHDARFQICWRWMTRSLGPGNYLLDRYPPKGLWLKKNAIHKIKDKPIYTFVYKSKDDETYVIDTADTENEANRLRIARSMDHYPDRLGHIRGVMEAWAELMREYGDGADRKKADDIRNWFKKS